MVKVKTSLKLHKAKEMRQIPSLHASASGSSFVAFFLAIAFVLAFAFTVALGVAFVLASAAAVSCLPPRALDLGFAFARALDLALGFARASRKTQDPIRDRKQLMSRVALYTSLPLAKNRKRIH